jgi:hypothetical protein
LTGSSGFWRLTLTPTQRRTLEEQMVRLGVREDDVVVLSDGFEVEVVIGLGKGRPRGLVIDDAGTVVRFSIPSHNLHRGPNTKAWED